MNWSDLESNSIKTMSSKTYAYVEVSLTERKLYIQWDGSILSFTDSDGQEYSADLYLEEHGCPVKASMIFIHEHEHDSSGFDDKNPEPKDSNYPSLLQQLAEQATSSRKITVHTYGNKFKQYKHYSATERNFNARVINSSRNGLNLKNLRGTDHELQKAVASGRGFAEVMTRIVTTVEQDDLHFIGIFCTAGHHRSVACGELLKTYIYPCADVVHLTINK